MKVGVLALQGDFEAHARACGRLGVPAVEVRTDAQLADVDALIIPGGESTTFRIVGERTGLLEPLRERARGGLPIFGTCAGLIACATRIADGDPPILGTVDITVRRNAYGRQVDSFEDEIDVDGVGAITGVFIRAPRIDRVGPGVEVLARRAGEPVVVRSVSTILTAFHPELSGDDRLHRAFLDGLA